MWEYFVYRGGHVVLLRGSRNSKALGGHNFNSLHFVTPLFMTVQFCTLNAVLVLS